MRRHSVAIGSVVVCLAMLVFAQFLEAAAGGRAPIYIGVALLCGVPLWLGAARIRALAAVTVVLAVAMAVRDYSMGLRLQDRVREVQQRAAQDREAVSAPAGRDRP